MNYYNQENKSELIEFMTEMNTQLENKRLKEDLLMKDYLEFKIISTNIQIYSFGFENFHSPT